MLNTQQWVQRIFSYMTATNCYPCPRSNEDKKRACFMIIPSKGDKVEIPLFILPQYADMLKQNSPDNATDYISILLEIKGYRSSYASFDRIVKDVFNSSFEDQGLVKIIGKDGANTHTYYASKGALFDSNLKPLMLCTWEMEKRAIDPYQLSLHPQMRSYFTKPLLRIDPELFLSKPDNVGRFVLKKMVSLLLNVVVYTPMRFGELGAIYNHAYTPSLVVEKIPFEIKTVPAPSISTTRESLLNLVLDNLEDMQ